MSDTDKIEAGDSVCVNFNSAQYTLSSLATVLYVPTCTGDAWIIKDRVTGAVHYISEGCTVTKLSAAEKGSQ